MFALRIPSTINPRDKRYCDIRRLTRGVSDKAERENIMRKFICVAIVLAAGLVVGVDGAFAKGNKGGAAGGGKKGKRKGDVSAPAVVVGQSMTIAGTVKVDGDTVKLIAEDKTEYLLAISTALANKDKNGQKVTITGTVTEISGKKWLSADPKAEDKTDKAVEKKAGK
jgi:hypothetical protein